MKNTKLILLEGLPCSGKSTNSGLILRQLERNGFSAEWVHEEARPHPTLFFNEACLSELEYRSFIDKYPEARKVLDEVAVKWKQTYSIDLLEIEWNHLKEFGEDAYKNLQTYDVWNFSLEQYKTVTLEKWRYFVQQASERPNHIIILDSSIFQYQIFTFLLVNAPYKELQSFIDELHTIIGPLNPALIYLYRENGEDSIKYLESVRGTGFLENIWRRDRHNPYYQDRPEGAEGFRQFLLDYDGFAKRLFQSAPCDKLGIDISNNEWQQVEEAILSFLELGRKPSTAHNHFAGLFVNKEHEFKIQVDGLTITDPGNAKKRLIPRTEHEFYIYDSPVVLKFNKGGSELIIGGNQLIKRWTTIGTVYIRNE